MPLYEFDCKAWNVPNANDALASIIYRQKTGNNVINETLGQFVTSKNGMVF